MAIEEVKKKQLKTKLKFKEHECTGELVAWAFWDKTLKSLRGVNEDNESKKRICVLSPELKEKDLVKPGILYSVLVHSSTNRKSYIVDSVKAYKFKAKLETQIIKKCFYQTIITIGNQKVYYNPFDGKSEYSRTLDGVLELLQERDDILNKEEIINALKRSARTVNKYMEADGYILPSKKKAV